MEQTGHKESPYYDFKGSIFSNRGRSHEEFEMKRIY
jgi:hypothetical protein